MPTLMLYFPLRPGRDRDQTRQPRRVDPAFDIRRPWLAPGPAGDRSAVRRPQPGRRPPAHDVADVSSWRARMPLRGRRESISSERGTRVREAGASTAVACCRYRASGSRRGDPAAEERLVDIGAQVRGQDGHPLELLHALQEVGDFDIGVSIPGVTHLGPLPEDGVGLVEQQDTVDPFRLGEDPVEVLLRSRRCTCRQPSRGR